MKMIMFCALLALSLVLFSCSNGDDDILRELEAERQAREAERQAREAERQAREEAERIAYEAQSNYYKVIAVSVVAVVLMLLGGIALGTRTKTDARKLDNEQE